MKTAIFLIALFCLVIPVRAQEIQPGTRPDKTQRELLKRGYGMFIHYGMNTFLDKDWSEGVEPASTYHPTQLDCDQWVRIAREAGFRYVVLVTKHHDGFCLWDSKYTDYDVASSPVPTDLIAAVAKACKKYGLQLGLYYSLWDRHEPSYKEADFSRYVDYMAHQLTELMSNYGPICELWFDGGWDKPAQAWDIPRLYKLVKKLQPHCAISTNQTIAYRENSNEIVPVELQTTDNRYYCQYFPSDFRLWDPKIASSSDKKQYLYQGKSYYLPFEHTICLSSEWNWFQKSTPIAPRELDELEELFYWCTANQNTLVLNVAPDATGRIKENEANQIIALKNRLNLRKNKPFPTNGKTVSLQQEANVNSVWNNQIQEYGPQNVVDGGLQTRWASQIDCPELIIKLNERDKFNKISIFEYRDGLQNRIQAYTIDIWQDNRWTTLYLSQSPMGACKVIHLPQTYQTSQIRLKVLAASAPPSIYEFSVIHKE